MEEGLMDMGFCDGFRGLPISWLHCLDLLTHYRLWVCGQYNGAQKRLFPSSARDLQAFDYVSRAVRQYPNQLYTAPLLGI